MHDADADTVHNRHGAIAERDNRQPVSNAYPNVYSHRHGYTYSHTDADSYRYGYTYSHTDADSYCYGYGYGHTDADSHRHGYAYCHADSHCHGDPNPHPNPDAYGDPNPHANSHPNPLTHLAFALWQPGELGPGSLGWRAGVLVEVPGRSETEQPQPVPRECLLREAGACCPVEGHRRECLPGG